MKINENKIVRLIFFGIFGNIIDSLQTFDSRTLTLYLNCGNKIDFKDITEIQTVMRNFVWHYFLLFLILPIYRHLCIVYLHGMRPLGVFAWLLVSLAACPESLHGQCSITLVPPVLWFLVCMRTQLYLNLSVRFNLVGPHTKSLATLTLPDMCNHLEHLRLIQYTLSMA